MVTGAAAAALAAAALFAVATALQHRSAGLVTAAAGPGGFVTRTLRHPLWIAGALANLGGLALHALALRNGPLTLVQPLLVIGVIFSLPLRQVLERRRPGRAEIGWAAVLTAGLAVFLVLATTAGATAPGADPQPMAWCGAAIALAVAGCLAAAHRAAPAAAALLLGAGAGLLLAVTAGLLKQTTAVLGRGAGALLTSWPPYALVVVGAAGLLLVQYAYRAGPLSASLPAITAVNPLVSVVIGVAVFDEPFRTAPADLLGEVLGLAVMAVAAAGLTRAAPAGDRPAAVARPGAAAPSPGSRGDDRSRAAGRRPRSLAAGSARRDR